MFYQAKNLLNYTGSTLQNWRNRYFYYSTKHLNILGLLCKFEEINIFIILQRKKNSLYILGLLQNWRNKYFYYSTKHKKLFKNPWSSIQIWRNKYLYYQAKKIPEYTGSSLQIWKNKYFYQSNKHKKLLKYPGSSLQIWRNKYFIILPSKQSL